MRTKKTKKQAVLELSQEKLDFYNKNRDLLREMALRAIYKVFPKMRCGNLSGTDDLIQSCREKCLTVLPKWSKDKALNSASDQPRNSKLTGAEWIAKKQSNPEFYLQQNFEFYMFKAMINKLGHVRDAEDYATRHKAPGIEIRSTPWDILMDKSHGPESDGHMFMGDGNPDEILFGADKAIAQSDYDYAIELAKNFDTKASLLWVSTLPDKRQENFRTYAQIKLNSGDDLNRIPVPADVFNDAELSFGDAVSGIESVELDADSAPMKRKAQAS